MTYPTTVNVHAPNRKTVRLVRETGARNVAELGVYRGHTTLEIAKALPADGSLDLFDFEETVQRVAAEARAVATCSVRAHGNSHKLRDSYCWSLMRLLKEHRAPIWDYVYIDGAHTWDVDGFAFLLCAELLRPGGYVDFDDYGWTLAGSAALMSSPETAASYTDEQLRTPQVALVVDLLARRRGFEEVEPCKLFRKPR